MKVHAYLDFNTPLSDAHAASLIAGLWPLKGAQVVDLGCGWAELLLRLLESEPTATGFGMDADDAAIERGLTNVASRGLSDRVRLSVADVHSWTGSADVAISIGASHAWGGTRETLTWVRKRLRPGDRFLFGEAFWQRPPNDRAREMGDFGSIADLVDLAMSCGYRLLALSEAGLDEWDSFESRFCAGRERWLIDHPDDEEVRAAVDKHRTRWLRGYRTTLGFAYLTLVATGRGGSA